MPSRFCIFREAGPPVLVAKLFRCEYSIDMKRIYVVEDHDAIRDGVVRYLEISGYEAVGMATVAEERKAMDENLPDLVIQDVMLPDGDGFLFVKELRSRGVDVPVIFMTARSEESDRILGFELGADDYISKPFSPKELVLRVGALFRRMEHGSVETRPEQRMAFSSGPDRLVIDIGAHRVTIDDEERPLTAAEWRILTYLAGNEGRLVSRSEILEKCFDYALDSYERVVDTHIKNIRAKLRPGAWIETVRGYGYRFCPYGEDDE